MRMSVSARPRTWLRTAAIIAIGLVVAVALPLTAQQAPDLSTSLVFRDIGPTRQGNRYVEFAVVESTPRIFYVAAATGGLFKTENNGITFTPVFENQPVASLGAVAVSQSNPDVVYVGTGEANNSRSSYYGNGVYVSTNGGQTWTHRGLPESHHIGRIVVHPTDPNTAYVAALGHLYSENEERGLYKTTDGGVTWTKSLGIKVDGRDIGVVDVAMDSKNPAVLYAATYDKVRRPWTFAEAGPGSGIYKTADAGRTWTKLAGGLPTTWLGRIGLAVYRQDPNTVYAVIENAGNLTDEQKRRFLEGFGTVSGSPTQLYRSDDAGRTWRQVAPVPAPEPPAGGARGAAPAGGGRGGGGFDGGSPAYYYGQVRVDPNNRDNVFVLSVGASRSFDGGRTWQGLGSGGDNHALWINPKDSNHMLLGYDHGLTITFDNGATWHHPDNMPGAQFYAIGYDMAMPYNVYGGLQDNGSHKGPSTMKNGGNIPFEAWSTVGGGDGMYNVVDWKDSRFLYNESQFGVIQRLDMVTGESAGIQYRRTPVPGQPAPEPLRWNWCAPILVSPHDADVIYHAAQVVLRSPFRGHTWEEISPDLTVNDPARRGGGGNITYATITTLDESPIVPGLLWAGTDDGNVQVTRDGGRSWTNVRDKIPGHPGYWVSRVVASRANPGTAYVTVTGLRHDDFRPFIWRTNDFGATWTSIAANLPNESINVVREDPRNSNLLFAGTDLGVYMTLNAGVSWTKLRGAVAAAGGGGGRGGGFGAGGGRGGRGGAASTRGLMPTNPVHDLHVHPRDRELIIGTHGRGIFIADISAFQDLTPAVLAAEASLLDPVPAVLWAPTGRGAVASNNYPGMSRPTDMGLSYYLRGEASGDPLIRIYDGSRMIAELTGPRAAGLHTVRWNLQARRETIAGEAPAGGRGGRGGGGRGGAAAAPAPAGPAMVSTPVRPGEYRVVLTVNGREYERKAIVLDDPARRSGS